MPRILAVFVVPAYLIALLAAVPAARCQEVDAAAVASRPGPTADGQVERGRYLVQGVAMCGQCHTPRDAEGELQMQQWLKGAPVPVPTPDGYAAWAYKAPRIAGLPQHTDEEFVTLMTTGVNRDGTRTRLPMPQFRMTEADALAIAAYLRSLD